MKLGIFGGTFNPIHYGHLIGAEEVREYFQLDKIIFVPSGVHPLKTSDIIDASHRFKMTELALKENTYFEISDYEIGQKEPSYTVNTLKFFKELYPRYTLFFIIGVDSFYEIKQWHKPDELIRIIDFIVMSRPGYRSLEYSDLINGKEAENIFKLKNSDKKAYYIEIFPVSISSSFLRERIRKNKSIRYFLPEEVRMYIQQNRLYKE